MIARKIVRCEAKHVKNSNQSRSPKYKMAVRTSDMLKQVEESHQLDHDALLRYASANICCFPSSPSSFSISQFRHGQSNPTFLLEVGEGSGEKASVKRYVLRKKPPGKLLQSAHSVDREFQVLRALGEHTQVPVPKVFSFCSDSSVVGTEFYIMEYLEGRIFVDPMLPGIAPDRRKMIYREAANALAALHLVDVDAIGLGNYGRRDNYCKRQIERWTRQYIASTGIGKSPQNPKFLELSDWLRKNIPYEDSLKAASGLVHGDFRIDNIVFHLTEDRVIGILDWELSTLGNQMSDIASNCLAYMVDANLANKHLGKGLELIGIPEGIPSLAEYLGQYCYASKKPWPASDWRFYVAFSMFRGASIHAGVHYRWIMGNASGGEHAQNAGNHSNGFIETAWAFISRKFILPDHPPLDGGATNAVSKGCENFTPSRRVMELRKKLVKFMEDHIYPLENEFYKLAQSSSRWTIHPEEERLKELAKKEGLWNLWIPIDSAEKARKLISNISNPNLSIDASDWLLGAGLSNLEYGYLCEIMGRSLWAPQVFNCSAPDTGNMEVLLRYGTQEQQLEWLVPLLRGEIRSGFAMTEPQAASSDATNIECSIRRQGNSYVINGNKWWTSGAMDPRCSLLIVMGCNDSAAEKHKQHSMILVDIRTSGVHVKRSLLVFGFDDAPHGHSEISFENVVVPAKNILLGEGRGFEIAQGRLGSGRLHHCMRLIGAAERGMEMMVDRALNRRTFGKLIADHGSFRSDIAKCRIELERTRLLVYKAADQLDRLGHKDARGLIAMAKVAAPNMALVVLDKAMQVHGAAGLSSDMVLAHLWAAARSLRIADGPDEVHLATIAKLELLKPKF